MNTAKSDIIIRKAEERGHANHGWLDTNHSFSFSDYYDPRYMGFRNLLVINEDFVKAGHGFPTHPHRDMEIISYVLDGGLQHKDSMGNGSVIVPGEVQRMSAGTGVTHSEYNQSKQEDVHFLQIWIMPEKKNLKPGYEQRMFKAEEKQDNLRLVAAADGRDGAVNINADAYLYSSLLDYGQQLTYQLKPDRYGWLQVARGSVNLNGRLLKQGDGAAITAGQLLTIEGQAEIGSEVLLFDLL